MGSIGSSSSWSPIFRTQAKSYHRYHRTTWSSPLYGRAMVSKKNHPTWNGTIFGILPYTPPLHPAPTPPPPMVPDTVPSNIILPYSQAILHTLSTHSSLNQLAHGALVQTYPTSVLFTNPFPPFKTHANPFLLSPPLLLKLPFLIAYFKGWESFQSSNAAIVLREESGVVTHYAFGSLDNFYRLYLFIFDSLQESFQFSLLIQGIEPPCWVNHDLAWHACLLEPSRRYSFI